jgi:hypothetical protein
MDIQLASLENIKEELKNRYGYVVLSIGRKTDEGVIEANFIHAVDNIRICHSMAMSLVGIADDELRRIKEKNG